MIWFFINFRLSQPKLTYLLTNCLIFVLFTTKINHTINKLLNFRLPPELKSDFIPVVFLALIVTEIFFTLISLLVSPHDIFKFVSLTVLLECYFFTLIISTCFVSIHAFNLPLVKALAFFQFFFDAHRYSSIRVTL